MERRYAKPITKKRLAKMHFRCLQNFMKFAGDSGIRAKDFIEGMHHTYMTSPDGIRTGRVLIRVTGFEDRDLIANVEVVFDGVTYLEIYQHDGNYPIWDKAGWEVHRIGLECEKHIRTIGG